MAHGTRAHFVTDFVYLALSVPAHDPHCLGCTDTLRKTTRGPNGVGHDDTDHRNALGRIQRNTPATERSMIGASDCAHANLDAALTDARRDRLSLLQRTVRRTSCLAGVRLRVRRERSSPGDGCD